MVTTVAMQFLLTTIFVCFMGGVVSVTDREFKASVYRVGSLLNSDWFVNSFRLVVYENIFGRPLNTSFWLNQKLILIDNHLLISQN